MLGLSFEGLEPIAWELFTELEKREVARQTECEGRRANKERIPREIRNLNWGISYEKSGGIGGVDGEASARKERGSRSCHS